MALGFDIAIRNAWLNSIVSAAGSGAFIRIYGGTPPATGGTVTTILAQLTVGGTFGTVSAGVLTVGSVTGDTSADNTGTATWFRVVTSASVFVMDGLVSTSGSDLNLNTTSIVTGAAVNITSFTITAPNA